VALVLVHSSIVRREREIICNKKGVREKKIGGRDQRSETGELKVTG
jgi:hypothetical protein